MTSEFIEERSDGYYIAGTRISLDSVVYSFERVNSPVAIQREYPLLSPPRIYGAIAFHLDHRRDVRSYLDAKEKDIGASSTPLAEATPELRARLQRSRQATTKAERRPSAFLRMPI
jgi:uncharacterized protein (DUF433 family)